MAISRRLLVGRVAAGLLLTGWLMPKRAAAQALQYSYDPLGRLVGVVYPDGVTVTYTYDSAGNRTQVVRTAAPPPPPPPPPPLTASVNATSWSWPSTTPVTATAIGGLAPYNYAWVRISGDNATEATAPSSASTLFERFVIPPGPPKVSYWRCTITDAASQVAQTSQVQVFFYPE